jgi:hypothetical protein
MDLIGKILKKNMVLECFIQHGERNNELMNRSNEAVTANKVVAGNEVGDGDKVVDSEDGADDSDFYDSDNDVEADDDDLIFETNVAQQYRKRSDCTSTKSNRINNARGRF